MLYRKIRKKIVEHLSSGTDKIMIVQGARQVGKSYIIRDVCKELFPNYVELNFARDKQGEAIFADVKTTENFYVQLGGVAGDRLGKKEDTIIFLDEIQEYPQMLTLLKFLREEKRYTYIASGSLLGIALRNTLSIPVGSVRIENMYPLDFEEFLKANGIGDITINSMRESFRKSEALNESLHNRIMDLFRKYLLVGGFPDAVNEYLETFNIVKVREIQSDIRNMYIEDAAKYENDALKKLQIRRIYEMIPSIMENKKKRIKAKEIESKDGARMDTYADEFEYLISSGIAIAVRAISTPVFPLAETANKNLLKLYLNDVGLLTGLLYHTNINAVLRDERGINLGAVYETVVGQELLAHGNVMFYYDNRKNGEVDYLINDYDALSVVPIEVKSGRDHHIHSALDRFTTNEDYHIKHAIVLSNEREIKTKGTIRHIPVYYAMFL